MNVKSVELVFENCECIKFKYPNVCYLTIDKISTKFRNFVNCIQKAIRIEDFELIIKKDAIAKKVCVFGGDSDPLNRITNDITHLIIQYDNGQKETYIVIWPEDDEYYHKNQKIIRTEKGNIYINNSLNGDLSLLSHTEIDDYAR